MSHALFIRCLNNLKVETRISSSPHDSTLPSIYLHFNIFAFALRSLKKMYKFPYTGLCHFAESVNTNTQQHQQQSYGDVIGSDEPQFLTKGHLYRAVVNDTIVLPCKVHNLGTYVLLWRRGPAVLTAQKLMVTRDARFKITDGYNLQISNVRTIDAGDYVCQIGDVEPKDQVHTLEILVPPTIKSVPEHGVVTARQGGSATLECRASGNPSPHISWFKKVNVIYKFFITLFFMCKSIKT